MNYKYFGNALDLFKFDLITYLSHHGNEEVFYVPMITEPQPKEYDPKYLTYEVGSNNDELLQFLKSRFEQTAKSEIEEIKNYFHQKEIGFTWFSSNGRDDAYFKDEIRDSYFEKALAQCKLLEKKTLIYCDPDIGSDVGIIRRFRSKRDMYLKGADVLKIKNQIKSSDYIGYFQHLGNTNYSIHRRLTDLKDFFGKWVLIAGYSRIQASIVLTFNTEIEYEDKREKIKRYFKQYESLEHASKFVFQ